MLNNEQINKLFFMYGSLKKRVSNVKEISGTHSSDVFRIHAVCILYFL